MHKLLDKYLCEKYPKIFSERNLSRKESCMSEGITCGDGWFSLLDNLCYSIQKHIDNLPFQLTMTKKYEGQPEQPEIVCPQVIAKQIKEKFGSLRFYFKGGDEYISILIDQAENLSTSICEDCGRMDNTVGRNNDGWIRTTCSEHTRNIESFQFNADEKLKAIFEQI